ncbi:MAG: DUF3783 domain-containing protein [Spirochaetales bacterium]|nr:DUF3783 domain-containing protein [Spirochaetales bacterium]
MENDKFIFINGFSQKETMEIIKAVKSITDKPGDIAFAMGTETNRNWVVKDLIKEVREEHEYMTKKQEN